MQDRFWLADQWGTLKPQNICQIHRNLTSTLSRFRKADLFFVCAAIDVWSYHRNRNFSQRDTKLIIIADLRVISMLVTDVGDEMCWWRFWPFLSPTSTIFFHKRRTPTFKTCLRHFCVTTVRKMVVFMKNYLTKDYFGGLSEMLRITKEIHWAINVFVCVPCRCLPVKVAWCQNRIL